MCRHVLSLSMASDFFPLSFGLRFHTTEIAAQLELVSVVVHTRREGRKRGEGGGQNDCLTHGERCLKEHGKCYVIEGHALSFS